MKFRASCVFPVRRLIADVQRRNRSHWRVGIAKHHERQGDLTCAPDECGGATPPRLNLSLVARTVRPMTHAELHYSSRGVALDQEKTRLRDQHMKGPVVSHDVLPLSTAQHHHYPLCRQPRRTPQSRDTNL